MPNKRKKSGAAVPPAKKAKVEQPVEETPTPKEDKNDDPIVRYQKEHMLLRIKELNRELSSLRHEVASFESEKAAYHDQISDIDRHWTQLDEILSRLLKQLPDTGEISADQAKFSDQLVANMRGQVPSLLEAVLNKRKVQQDYSELDKRSEFSRNVVKRLVRAICAEQHRNERLELQLKNAASNNSASLEALSAANESLRSRINDLETNNQELLERNSSIQKEFKDYKNYVETLQEKLSSITEERDRFEGQLILAKRNMDKLQGNNSAPSSPATPVLSSVPSQVAKTPSASPKVRFKKAAAAAQQNTMDLNQAQEEIAKLKEKVEKHRLLAKTRLDEVNEYGIERESLIKELLKLRQQINIIPDEKILESHLYQSLKNKLQEVQNDNIMLREQLSLSKLQAMQAHEASVKELEATKTSFAEIRESLKQELTQLQNTLAQANKEKLAIQIELTSRVPPNPQTNSELSECVQLQQSELSKLRTEHTNLNNEISTLTQQLSEVRNAEQEIQALYASQNVHFEDLKRTYEQFKNSVTDSEKLEKVNLLDKIRELSNINRNLSSELQKLTNSAAPGALDLDAMISNSLQVHRLDIQSRDLAIQLERSDKQLKESNKALQDQKMVADAMISEIDAITQALTQLQSQNVRLLQQLNEKDDRNAQLMKDCINLEHRERLLKDDHGLSQKQLEQCQSANKAQEELRKAETTQSKLLRDQLNKIQEEIRIKSQQIESQQRLVKEAHEKNMEITEQNKQLKTALDEISGSDERLSNLNNEAIKAKRLEEEKLVLKKKLDKLKASKDTVLKEEVKTYKAMITCAVCKERRKSAVIAKCFHVFCRQCIQLTLSARHRKCPGCARPFSDSDVHDIYLNFQ